MNTLTKWKMNELYRIYFKVSEDRVTVLDLFESKTNPERNKYE